MTASAASHVRVLLVGSQPISLAGLRLLLEADDSGIQVLGECSPAPGLGDTGQSDRADVVLLDLDGGADLLTVLAPSIPRGTRLLVLTSTLDQATLALAFRHGATGAVRKQQSPATLTKAVHAVHSGEMWLEHGDMERLVTELAATPPAASAEARRAALLTPREREVVSLVGEGLRNQQIAGRLHISEVTVRNHLTSVFHKLRLTSRFQLALYAFKYGLSTLPATFRSILPARSPRKRLRKKKVS